MKTLQGNTYPHKEKIKELGGKWDAQSKNWIVPEDKFEELDKLCNYSMTKDSEKKSSFTFRRPNKKFNCEDCGDDVYPGSNCWETGLTH